MTEKPAKVTVPKFKDECSLTRGVEVSDLLKVKKEAVLYVQPCVSEKGRLMADIDLKREEKEQLIDPATLCSLLEVHRRRFSDLKCSPDLGVAKLKWKGREISIIKSGKLKIQRALDRDEILRVANSLARLVWGAAICDVCGQPTIKCASGECGKCALDKKTDVKLDEIPDSAPLVEGYSSLRSAIELSEQGAPEDDIEKALRNAKYLALFFTMEVPGKEDAALGLVLLGEAERVK